MPQECVGFLAAKMLEGFLNEFECARFPGPKHAEIWRTDSRRRVKSSASGFATSGKSKRNAHTVLTIGQQNLMANACVYYHLLFSYESFREKQVSFRSVSRLLVWVRYSGKAVLDRIFAILVRFNAVLDAFW
jgi:hypothetical protein